LPLTEDGHVIEKLISHGFDPALGVGIQIRRPWRIDHWFYIRRPQHGIHAINECRIAVMDHMRAITQEPIDRVGQPARSIRHPFGGRVLGDPGDEDLAGVVANAKKT